MRNIFYNDNRMRSGWAIFFAYIVFAVISLALKNALYSLGVTDWIVGSFQNISLFVVSAVFCKIILNEKLRFLGLEGIKESWRDIILGIMLSGLFSVLIYIIAIWSERVVMLNGMDSPNYTVNIVYGFVLYAVIAFCQETFFRAYCMNNLKYIGSIPAMVIIASLISTYTHLDTGFLNFLPLLTLMFYSCLLCYMYLKTESLFLPIGYHFGWEFMSNTVFSFEGNGVFNIEIAKNGIISGYNAGPEYGIIGLIFIILSFIFVNVYVYAGERNKAKYIEVENAESFRIEREKHKEEEENDGEYEIDD